MSNEMKSPDSQPSIPKGQDEIQKIASPLSGVDPRSLDAIMASDVELLSDGEIDMIVAELQSKRKIWAENEAAGRSQRGKAEKKTVSLDELGLI